MRLIMIAAIFFGLGNMLQAQVTTGTIMGKVLDADSSTILPFARVSIDCEGGKRGAVADAEGKYKIDALKPGVYNVNVTYVGKGEMIYAQVHVTGDAITFLDVVMKNGNVFEPIVVTATKPLIDKYIPRINIPTEYIEHSPDIRNPLALLGGYSSEIRVPEGTSGVIIRGSRPGDAVYYIDGVKMTDMSAVPGVAIGALEAYTGGIPAKYGDTTGGVVILETKSYFDLYNAWLAGQ